MSLKITFDNEKLDWCYRTRMNIIHNGKVIATHYDGGEPEDQSFGRDWNWVPSMIEKAYKLGREDGIKEEDEDS